MSLIIQKFGGSSVSSKEKILKAAKIVIDQFKKNNNVVVVVSAQGKTTDKFVKKYQNINKNASKRELDVLLSSGEQISASLFAMAVEKLGFDAVSLLGWQIPIITNSKYNDAKILNIKTRKIKKEINKNRIVIVAGFQGIDKNFDITTIGRGGSDTTAVALAVYLKADFCQIYTDVDGVYDKDPNKFKTAKKIKKISYDDMLKLSLSGARILHYKSIEMAKKHKIKIKILSIFNNSSGSIVEDLV